MLAICRGMQVLNVAMGGTLIQDIPREIAGALDPLHSRAAVRDRARSVGEQGLALWTIMLDKLDGESLQVNSRHHQAVKRLGAGLRDQRHRTGRRDRRHGAARQPVLRGRAVAPRELLADRRVPPALRAVRPRRRRLGLAPQISDASVSLVERLREGAVSP